MIDLNELQGQFKVFHDPNFTEFVQIVGKEFDDELPLFAQLYILKEIQAFYTYADNKAFLPLLGLNMVTHFALFFFNNLILKNKAFKLLSGQRVFAAWLIYYLIYQESIMKG